MNNAGIYHFQPLEDITEDEFHLQFNTNVLGTILAAKEAAKHFGPDGGSIINISSVASEQAMPTATVYSATKGAVDTLTRVLAAELGPRKIRVNAIAPGGVETEGTHAAGVIGSDFEKDMVAHTALGRLGQPDDIARVAVFLASDDPPGSPASGSPRRAGITDAASVGWAKARKRLGPQYHLRFFVLILWQWARFALLTLRNLNTPPPQCALACRIPAAPDRA